jgi:hypothetical protein
LGGDINGCLSVSGHWGTDLQRIPSQTRERPWRPAVAMLLSSLAISRNEVAPAARSNVLSSRRLLHRLLPHLPIAESLERADKSAVVGSVLREVEPLLGEHNQSDARLLVLSAACNVDAISCRL